METIAAIATAQSPSAIGIVRLSGEETRRVLMLPFLYSSRLKYIVSAAAIIVMT